MIRTYALQTLLAVASAVVTVSLLAATAGERAQAPSTACPLAESLLAGALPFAAPAPAPAAAPSTSGAPEAPAASPADA